MLGEAMGEVLQDVLQRMFALEVELEQLKMDMGQ
jgi:hypothetical protein